METVMKRVVIGSGFYDDVAGLTVVCINNRL